MSATERTDSSLSSVPQGTKSKKSGNNSRKKKGALKAKGGEDSSRVNGVKTQDEANIDEPQSVNGATKVIASDPASSALEVAEKSPVVDDDASLQSVGSLRIDESQHTAPNGTLISASTENMNSSSSDQAALHQQIGELRRSLEEMQEQHEQGLATLREQLTEAQNEKEHAETQYRNLLGKLNAIRSQLGDRLKADAEELSQARSQIEELEESNKALKNDCGTLEHQVSRLSEESEQRSKELSSLRNRTNLSQQNWAKERDDLISRETFAKEEFEAAKQAMQDWEVLAMEERSIRENLADKVLELEGQLTVTREMHEKAAADRDSQSLAVDGLQRALQDIQDARKQELRELVESNKTQVESLQNKLRELEKLSNESRTELESTKAELARALPFEKEVKEKNLLIGKLRHQGVILNEHLTKALRSIKKRRPEDNVDRQIVTNHLLHFLALDRADPKKYQVLQVIAAYLDWTDEQREQSGLSRPGASNTSLRTPLSPFHRTPSTPALNSELFSDNSTSRETLAELWSGFLEQEAHEGSNPGSRSQSISGTARPNSSSPGVLGPQRASQEEGRTGD
ncbi:MAG: hypothetical protein M1825_003360 [Sarcosagium campestre]|nr:MAG: hypothetical protein M1825_003360 [Sarcosagium campestre]